MNRLELSHALSAVIPHAGKRAVGLETRHGLVYVHATDRYTIGVATIPGNEPLRLMLTAKEAGELERWIRPQRIPEKTQEVALIQQGEALHVGIVGPEGDVEDSTQFDVTETSELDDIRAVLAHAAEAKLENRAVSVNPAFLARFAKAGDNVRIEFKRYEPRFGAFLVHAPNFVGLAANLAYWSTNESEHLASLLAS